MTGIWVGPHFRWRNVNHLQKRGETRKCWASQVELVVKNSPASVGRIRDVGLITGLGRSPGGENGNPLQYSCLENSMDKGAWQATVPGIAKSRTRLSDYHSFHPIKAEYIFLSNACASFTKTDHILSRRNISTNLKEMINIWYIV